MERTAESAKPTQNLGYSDIPDTFIPYLLPKEEIESCKTVSPEDFKKYKDFLANIKSQTGSYNKDEVKDLQEGINSAAKQVCDTNEFVERLRCAYKKKHLEYLGLRFGKKTKEYFDALFDVYYQYRDQGYYDFALDTLKEIDQTIELLEKHVGRLRDMSPLWEMVQEGIDLKSIEWTQDASHHHH